VAISLATVAPALAGLFYLALGLAALARPTTLLSGFGLAAEGVDARNEVRAVYGGFPLAVAGLVAWSLSGAPHATGILLALAVASLGMAVGRLMSAVIDRRIGRLPALFICVELALALLLAAGVMLG
jgi:dolichol kinase